MNIFRGKLFLGPPVYFILIYYICHFLPASCDYWRWGSGGRQENINAICILGLNHINDKVFLLLWWWCLFITLVAFFRLVWRAAQTRCHIAHKFQLLSKEVLLRVSIGVN